MRALITGCSSGIGKEIARRLAAEGISVAGTYNSNPEGAMELEEIVKENGGMIKTYQCNVYDLNEIENVLNVILNEGRIDYLVNNVGGTLVRKSFMDVDMDVWDQAYNLNLRQAVFFTREILIRSMVPQNKGRVLFMSSVSTRTGAPNLGIHYPAFKSALNTLALGLAKEMAPKGIQVNAIAPGTIDTPLHRDSPPGHLSHVAKKIPAGRVGKASEIADVTKFLLLDAPDFLTGETIYVTGGY